MTDILTKEKRSWNMSRIHSKDTSIEVKVRKWLFHHGYRYRKNVKKLPGTPDIVLNSYNTVIFVNGCFWHRHTNCKKATTPQTRKEFWNNKFLKNVLNDSKNKSDLEQMGYNVIVVWECELTKNFDDTMNRICDIIGPPKKR